jgi:hypothetical protein
MAKKKRAAKRLTKVGKRRPSTETRAAAKRKAPPPPGAFQGLPPSASQGKRSEAVRSTTGTVSPPHTLSAGAGLTTQAAVVDKPPELRTFVPVTPTAYPPSPPGSVIVLNYVTVNGGSPEFKNFNVAADALVKQLQTGGSNEISGDVCAQVLSEITAGRELLKAPKPNRELIQVLLVNSLEFLMKTAAGAIIGNLAGQALHWLMQML